MKALISIVLIVAIWFVGNKIYTEYKAKDSAEKKRLQQANSGTTSDGLEGMNPEWEPSLQVAQSQGAGALKLWLDRYRPHLRDPKLAAIELDYVLLLSRQDPATAKTIFQNIRKRIHPDSPVYARVKKLESTYGR